MPRTGSLILMSILVLASLSASAAPTVEARALMRDMAVLVIDGRETLLRVGETGPGGVELLSADARSARVRVGDEEVALGLTDRLGSAYAAPETREVRVARDNQGHFRVAGAIEGRPVLFMVDTGATILAMSSRHAEALGIDYEESGREGRVVTAAGNASSHFVMLDEVRVGGITVNTVQAAVVEGAYPQDILLGMSFLKHVGLSEDEGVLTIRQKY
jgi:aspartyl protease family protein